MKPVLVHGGVALAGCAVLFVVCFARCHRPLTERPQRVTKPDYALRDSNPPSPDATPEELSAHTVLTEASSSSHGLDSQRASAELWTGRIGGVCYAPQGVDLKLIHVLAITRSGRILTAITVNPAARFDLHVLPEGTITILVIPHTQANVAPAYQEIEILPGTEHVMEFTLQAGSTISGSVVDAHGNNIQGAELLAVTTIACLTPPALATRSDQQEIEGSNNTPWFHTDDSLTVTFQPRTGEVVRRVRLDSERFTLGGFEPSSARLLIQHNGAILADQWIEPGTEANINLSK